MKKTTRGDLSLARLIRCKNSALPKFLPFIYRLSKMNATDLVRSSARRLFSAGVSSWARNEHHSEMYLIWRLRRTSPMPFEFKWRHNISSRKLHDWKSIRNASHPMKAPSYHFWHVGSKKKTTYSRHKIYCIQFIGDAIPLFRFVVIDLEDTRIPSNSHSPNEWKSRIRD